MTTQELFRDDSYLAECSATVLAVHPATEGDSNSSASIVLDRTVFYPLGGGQAGDSGQLLLQANDGSHLALTIADTRKGKNAEGQPDGSIVHLLAPGQDAMLAALRSGMAVTARIDWERRHRMMRLHSSTHLLCHVVPQLVNGCSITPDYARMDFAMDGALDKEALSAALAALASAALPFTVASISDEELDANPALVKSMSVSPPRGTGRIRTIHIGNTERHIDLQPCGGTHVANSRETAGVVVTKIEKKGANSRRVVLGFA